MAKGFTKRVVQAGDIPCDQQCADHDDCNIGAQFFITEDILYPLQQKQVITAEVDTEQQHEYRRNILKIRAVAREGIRLDSESAGTGSTECMTYRIEQRHSADEQEDDIKDRQRNVNHIQNRCGLTHPRNQFADGGSG